MADIDLPAYAGLFNTGKNATINSYGHYTATKSQISTPTLKQVTTTFKRNGGHVIAPRGFMGPFLIFNDPEGGIIQISEFLTMVPSTQTNVVGGVQQVAKTILPNGVARANALKVYQAGSYYPILEDMLSLVAPYK